MNNKKRIIIIGLIQIQSSDFNSMNENSWTSPSKSVFHSSFSLVFYMIIKVLQSEFERGERRGWHWVNHKLGSETDTTGVGKLQDCSNLHLLL